MTVVTTNNGPWVGNYGYCAFGTETIPGTGVTPTCMTLLNSETLTTDANEEMQTPIAGIPAEVWAIVKGLRTHKGDIEIIAEPNTATEVYDAMMLRGTASTTYTFTTTSCNATVGATFTNNGVTFTVTATVSASTTLVCTASGAPLASGTLTKATGTGDTTISFSAATAGPTTWPFTFPGQSGGVPNSKTIDISMGNVVKRFVGCQVSKITPAYTKDQVTLKASISALGSFQGAVLASTPTGSGPYTVAFDPTYDANPTSKLVVGDLIAFYHIGTAGYTTATIASIVDALHITTTTNVTGFAAGDIMYLRPQTVAFNLLNPFLWGNLQVCPGATAAAALSAAQVNVENGSSWELDYKFKSDDGEPRSGNFDPSALVRTTYTTSSTIKKFFDTPDDVIYFNQLSKRAWVWRHYAYGGANQSTAYEMRITFNHVVTNDPMPKIKSKDVNYSTIKYNHQYDQADSAEASVLVTSGLNVIP